MNGNTYKIQPNPFNQTFREMEDEERKERIRIAKERKEDEEMAQAHEEFINCMEGR